MITLENGDDYTLTWKLGYKADSETAPSQQLKDAGKYYARIEGAGDYTGTVYSSKWLFTIKQATVKADFDVALEYTSCTYDGTEKKPAVTVTFKSSGENVPADAYTVTYSKNTNSIAKAIVKVAGDGKNVSSSSTAAQTLYFEILDENLANAVITLEKDSYVYDGTEKKPGVTLTVDGRTLVEDVDYELSYDDNKSAGTAIVELEGIGNYTGIVTKNFTIEKANIQNAVVTLSQDAYDYDGKAKKPTVTVTYGSNTLKNKTDYTYVYENNIDAGTATVRITATEKNYTGETTKNFTIGKPSLADAMVTLSGVPEGGYAWTGKAQKPIVSVVLNGITLRKDTHYKVSYKKDGVALDEAIDKGLYTVVIEPAMANYTGTNETATFEINAAMYGKYGESVFTYNGEMQRPDATVTDKDTKEPLTEGTHYTASYTMNKEPVDSPVDAGAYSMKLSAKSGSGYGGYLTKSFTINKRDLKDVKVVLKNGAMAYTGNAIVPELKAFELNGKTLSIQADDFTMEYLKDGVSVDEMTLAGEYTVKVTAKESAVNYIGEQTVQFKIEQSGTNIEIGDADSEERLKSEYTYGEDICVTVQALPTGAAPMRMMRMAPQPAKPNQMALYVSEGGQFRQISDGVDADAEGNYKLIYKLSSKQLEPGTHTLYAGYTGNGNMGDSKKELGKVTIQPKPLTAFAHAVNRMYLFEDKSIVIRKVTLEGVEPGDDVVVRTESGTLSSDNPGLYTTLRAKKLPGGGLLGGADAKWYSLEPVMETRVEILSYDSIIGDLPKTGDPSMLGAWFALLGASAVGLKLRKKK